METHDVTLHRECYRKRVRYLCGIDGEVSDANKKVYGDGSAILKILFILTLEENTVTVGRPDNKQNCCGTGCEELCLREDREE